MTEDALAPAVPGFVVHAGKTGALISAQDWRESALGAPEGWPSGLKAVLATILGSPKPMYILWDPDLLFFFNDAYAPMLGARLDGAMGRPFAALWPELWTDFESILHKALGGEGSSYENMPLTLTRNGYTEPTWWTFSYLPLRDDSGAVVGVHCIITETTEQVRTQERQAFRVELGDALRDASDPHALMAVSAQKLGQYLNTGCVGYGEVDASGEWVQVHHDWTAEGSTSVAGVHWLDTYGPAMIAQLQAGRTVVVNDTATDPLTGDAAYGAAYSSIGARAFIDAPLIRSGRLAVIFFVIEPSPRVWTEGERELVAEAALALIKHHNMNRQMHRVRVDLLAHGYPGDRGPGLLARLDHLRFELCAVKTPHRALLCRLLFHRVHDLLRGHDA